MPEISPTGDSLQRRPTIMFDHGTNKEKKKRTHFVASLELEQMLVLCEEAANDSRLNVKKELGDC